MDKRQRSSFISKIKKKAYDEGFEDATSENLWLLTFGDLFTLLVAFFILLLAISVPDEAKFKETMAVLQNALGFYDNKAPVESTMEKIEQYLEDVNLKTITSLEDTTRGFKLSIAADFAFKTGEAILTEGQMKVLDGIAPILKDITNKIEINAHTDVSPIKTDKFASNWELSGMRASSAANYLTTKWEIQGARILSIGSAEFHPVYTPVNDQENMKKNRRLEIEILNEKLSKVHFGKK